MSLLQSVLRQGLGNMVSPTGTMKLQYLASGLNRTFLKTSRSPRRIARALQLLVCIGTIPVIAAPPAGPAPAGMVWIAGGEFSMGSDLPGSRRNEQPTHPVTVDGYWIDQHDVTNAEFRK